MAPEKTENNRHRVLITGGAGFIGSNLVSYLNRRMPSWEVAVLDDLSTGLKENLLGSRCDFFEGSILDASLLEEAASGANSIVHLAAIGSVPKSILAPFPTHDANVTGTLKVLEVARTMNIPQVVVASSSAVYGSNPTLPKRESDWVRPMSPYGVSKLATESYALAYSYSFGLQTLALRFFNVYGPRQRSDHDYAAVIPKFLSASLQNQTIVIDGDGTQSRDFTFVGSVCTALVEALKAKLHSQSPINLAFGTNTTINDLVKVIERLSSQAVKVEFANPRVGDVLASRADPRRMRELFPDLKPVPLEEGVQETLEWLKGNLSSPTDLD